MVSTLARNDEIKRIDRSRDLDHLILMSNGFSEIEKEAQKLPAAERERLAQKLFESVHRKELTEVDEAWLSVAEERISAYRSGRDQGIGEQKFFDRVQKNLGWK